MRRLILLVLIVLLLAETLPGVSAEPASQTQATPSPLIVLTEFNPWLPVIGSDSPVFALYDNGLVIYRSHLGTRDDAFFSVQLDEDALRDLLATLSVSEAFFELDDYYETVFKTDQPSSVIYVWRKQGREWKAVSVYGDLTADPEARNATPQPYTDLYDKLTAYHHDEATPWLPEFIEVLLWPADAQSADTFWPQAWPTFSDPRTVRRGEDSYSIYLPAEHLAELNTMRQQADVLQLGGDVWHFSWRYPFPSEELWLPRVSLPNVEAAKAQIRQWSGATFPESDWQVTVSASGSRVNVVWSRSDPAAVAFYSRLVGADPYTVEAVDQLIDDDWLQATMTNYDTWLLVTRCIESDYIVVHMLADSGDNHYGARYWAWSEDRNFNLFFMAYLQADSAEMERAAAELFGPAASCERG